MKKTRFLFDVPVTKDWLFYVFILMLFVNVSNGLNNVFQSGGLNFSYGGMISGLIDGLFRILLSWFPFIPIIYLIRKLFRKSRRTETEAEGS